MEVFRPACLTLLALVMFALAARPQEIYVGGPEPDDDAYGEDYYDESAVDGLPMVYEGDGMRFSIDMLDRSGMRAHGTIRLGRGAPMPFRMQMDDNGQSSSGQVQTPRGQRNFRACDQGIDTTIVELDGRRYRLRFLETQGGLDAEPQDPLSSVMDYVNPGDGQDDTNDARQSEPDPRIQQAQAERQRLARNSADILRELNSSDRKSAGDDELQGRASGGGPVILEQRKLGHAYTLLVPKGWKVEGGAWNPPAQAYNWIPSRNILITGPDGTTVHFKPDLTAFDKRPAVGQRPQPWTVDVQTGFMNVPMPGSLEAWGEWLTHQGIQRNVVGASSIRTDAAQIQEELSGRLRQLYAPLNQTMSLYNTAGARVRVDRLALTVRSSFWPGASAGNSSTRSITPTRSARSPRHLAEPTTSTVGPCSMPCPCARPTEHSTPTCSSCSRS